MVTIPDGLMPMCGETSARASYHHPTPQIARLLARIFSLRFQASDVFTFETKTTGSKRSEIHVLCGFPGILSPSTDRQFPILRCAPLRLPKVPQDPSLHALQFLNASMQDLYFIGKGRPLDPRGSNAEALFRR